MYSETNCKGLLVTPMKGTMFGCLSLFHTTASLRNDYAMAQVFLSGREKGILMPPTTNLGDGLEIHLGNSWALDAYFPAAVNAFPHIGSATVGGDRVIANSGKITGYVM